MPSKSDKVGEYEGGSYFGMLQARVEQWIDFSTLSIDGPASSWIYPLVMPQYVPYDKKVNLSVPSNLAQAALL